LTGRSLARAVRFAVVAIVLAGCGLVRTTSLSGCITTKNLAGEDVRAAGAVVMLVPASETFDHEWQELVAEFRDAYRAAYGEFKQARRLEHEARLGEQAAFAAYRGAVRARPGDRYTVREEESGVRVLSNQQPPGEIWDAVHAHYDASRKVADAARRVNFVIELHLSRAVGMIKKHHTEVASTDQAGCYTLGGVPLERVYVLANHGDRYWFRSVNAATMRDRVQFSPGESAWPGWPFTSVSRAG
jgi:hypothetical protein